MSQMDFTTSIIVDQSPAEAFHAVTNVRGWWSEEIEGDTAKLNDEFYYHYEDVHNCDIQLTEVIPNEMVVWFVKRTYFKFTEDQSEWTGTTMSFVISERDGKTYVKVTHHGLTPEYECFDICSNAWTHYIQGSLYNLITTGKGMPNATGKPQTDDEERLSAH